MKSLVQELMQEQPRLTQKDVTMLTSSRDRLVESLRKFDQYPNRGIDLAYQPRAYNTPDRRLLDRPIDCRHNMPWTECGLCSRPASP